MISADRSVVLLLCDSSSIYSINSTPVLIVCVIVYTGYVPAWKTKPRSRGGSNACFFVASALVGASHKKERQRKETCLGSVINVTTPLLALQGKKESSNKYTFVGPQTHMAYNAPFFCVMLCCIYLTAREAMTDYTSIASDN